MDELAKRFAELAEKYGPTVANAALEATRIEVYSTLVSAVIWAFVGGVFAYVSIFLFRKALSEAWDEITYLPAFLTGLIALSGLSFALWVFVDPWTWTALNHPELWIAKRAFKI